MADLVSYALTTVADVKETLGIASGNTSKDNLIKRKINQATRMIEAYCALPEDHHFKQATYTNEEYFGTGSNQFVFNMRPVTSVTSFQRATSSESDASWEDVESELYFSDNLDAGVMSLNFNENSRSNSYRITYVAGYDPIPADLAEACVALASYLIENSATGSAIKRKQEGSRSIEYAVPASESNIFEQLGLEDMLSRYIMTPILPDI